MKYAFDAVSEKGSFQNISKVLAKEGSKITLVLPGADYSDIPDYISHNTTSVGLVHRETEDQDDITIKGKDVGHVYVVGFFFPSPPHLSGINETFLMLIPHRYFRLFAKGLQEGWFSGHPHTVVPGGLSGIEGALANLKYGRVSAEKFIFKIEDTP